MWNMMSDICGINEITPFQGLPWRDDLFHRALPYAIDLWAFSPKSSGKSSLKGKKESLVNAFDLLAFSLMNSEKSSYTDKAKSLPINSIGQRPMELYAYINPKPQRDVINNHLK